MVSVMSVVSNSCLWCLLFMHCSVRSSGICSACLNWCVQMPCSTVSSSKALSRSSWAMRHTVWPSSGKWLAGVRKRRLRASRGRYKTPRTLPRISLRLASRGCYRQCHWTFRKLQWFCSVDDVSVPCHSVRWSGTSHVWLFHFAWKVSCGLGYFSQLESRSGHFFVFIYEDAICPFAPWITQFKRTDVI